MYHGFITKIITLWRAHGRSRSGGVLLLCVVWGEGVSFYVAVSPADVRC